MLLYLVYYIQCFGDFSLHCSWQKGDRPDNGNVEPCSIQPKKIRFLVVVVVVVVVGQEFSKLNFVQLRFFRRQNLVCVLKIPDCLRFLLLLDPLQAHYMGILVPIDPRRNPEVELEWLRGPNCFHARLLTDGRGKFFQTSHRNESLLKKLVSGSVALTRGRQRILVSPLDAQELLLSLVA